MEKRECLRSIFVNSDVYGVCFDKQQIVCASRDGIVRVYDFETSKCLMELQGHTARLRTVRFADDKIVSAGEDRSIKGLLFQHLFDERGVPICLLFNLCSLFLQYGT